MFINFFYTLRDRGIPVTPTSFIRLHKALSMGMIHSLEDFYTTARAILVKSERYFDSYDQVFAHHFRGMELHDPTAVELTEIARAMLDEWLKDPGEVARALGIDEEKLRGMTPEELIKYFLDRLKEQTGPTTAATGGSAPGGHRRWATRGIIPGA